MSLNCDLYDARLVFAGEFDQCMIPSNYLKDGARYYMRYNYRSN
jgi:hypothetical protein